MAKPSYKSIPSFIYLGILQLLTAFCAGIISILFIVFPKGPIFDYILGFLPDASLVNYSILGLLMLAVQVLGNLSGALFSFKRSESAHFFAFGLGGSEILWMVFQYFILHMHSPLILLFVGLSLSQILIGFIINTNVKNVKKEFRDSLLTTEEEEIIIAEKFEHRTNKHKKPIFEESSMPVHLKN